MSEPELSAQLAQPAAIPDQLEIVPLFGMVVYPQTVIPLAVGQASVVQLFNEPASGSCLLGLVALRAEDHRPENPRPEDCYAIGTVALVHRLLRLPDGTLRVAAQGLERFTIEEPQPDEGIFRARIRILPEDPPIDKLQESSGALKLLVEQIAGLLSGFNQELLAEISAEDNPQRLVYLVAATMLARRSIAERQRILELGQTHARIDDLRTILTNELRVIQASPSWIVPGNSKPAPPDQPKPASTATAECALLPGSAYWLRWAAAGGELTAIEAVKMSGHGQLRVTGQRGALLRDIAQVALSWVRTGAPKLGLAPDFYDLLDLHLHVPPGASRDDVGSAGVVVVTTLVSLLTRKPVIAGLALAGEITLHGRVLSVGRVRDKALAAYHLGVKTFILPAANARDLDELPSHIQSALTCIFVERIEEVLAAAFR
ncbi:MAG: LON peptidase substrate-binding domain-containing protein [Chloroflexales bacterium]|nr:LON peptidase substrate-binding domain-containing protein [Chloroflexales bacterium]